MLRLFSLLLRLDCMCNILPTTVWSSRNARLVAALGSQRCIALPCLALPCLALPSCLGVGCLKACAFSLSLDPHPHVYFSDGGNPMRCHRVSFIKILRPSCVVGVIACCPSLFSRRLPHFNDQLPTLYYFTQYPRCFSRTLLAFWRSCSLFVYYFRLLCVLCAFHLASLLPFSRECAPLHDQVSCSRSYLSLHQPHVLPLSIWAAFFFACGVLAFRHLFLMSGFLAARRCAL
jgi:hypothetical protein